MKKTLKVNILNAYAFNSYLVCLVVLFLTREI